MPHVAATADGIVDEIRSAASTDDSGMIEGGQS